MGKKRSDLQPLAGGVTSWGEFPGTESGGEDPGSSSRILASAKRTGMLRSDPKCSTKRFPSECQVLNSH